MPNTRPINQPVPTQSEREKHTQWHTLHCELVTPMYGGGVESTKVDKNMPIRVTAIRGQLRFWWRLLAKQKWGLQGDALRNAEFALWGGMNDGDTDGQASKVWLRVTDVPNEMVIQKNLTDYDEKEFSGLRYALFPAYNETDESLKPHQLLAAEKINWTLQFALMSTITQTQINQVIETFKWWANFGGLGFRTRRGLGAVHISQCDDYPEICEVLTSEEVEQVGCRLVQKSTTPDPLKALETVITKLADFRQKPGIGRNVGQQVNRPGRSRWPEPDALRRIYRRHAKSHEPTHPASNVFPRALFGLPIMFDFGPSAAQGDPHQKTMLQSTTGERYASPLILRPTYAGTNQKGEKLWKASALLLPYETLKNMEVEIDGKPYPIWKTDTAQHIPPIKDNGGADNNDSLQAFLTYFAK